MDRKHLAPQALNSKGEEVRGLEGLGQDTLDHIKSHVSYPISKTGIISECDNMQKHGTPHVEHDREWLDKNLPDQTYNSADEVLSAIGM